jgi:transcriptional regulator GlxA family with amidase domain
MHIAILTFEGFNELDSFIALGILNRVKQPGWRVSIACPTPRVRSMNGVVVDAQVSLREANSADAVIVGSGLLTRDIVKDRSLMSDLHFWAHSAPGHSSWRNWGYSTEFLRARI